MEIITVSKRTEIFRNFNLTQKIYLATCNGEKPQVRPITLMFLDNRFYIATGSLDAKIKQIEDNNNIQLCYSISNDKNEGYIRISAKADLVQKIEVKKNLMDSVEFLKHFWSDPMDSSFMLYRVEPETVEYMAIGDMKVQHYQL